MKTKSKRFISILLSAIMIASMSFTQLTAYAQEPEQPAIEDAEIITTGTEAEVQAEIVEVSENSDTDTFIPAYSQELLSAYTKLCEYISANNISADISLETFANEYVAGNYSSLENYLNAYYSLLVVPSEVSSENTRGDDSWYYNTGTVLMDEPNYDTYNLLNVVAVGDILYEDEGGSGLTGHIAIVEGIYYDTNYSQFYIRLVEAIGYISGSIGDGDGVCRSVLDDDRYVNRDGTLLRVTSADSTQKSNAVSFCVGQIGKGYSLDLGHDTSTSEADWYCSELVWAAYKAQGIELETNSTLPGITPHELRDSTLTSARTVTTVGRPIISSISTGSSTSATIYWSSVSGATTYYVYRATSISGTYSLVTTTSNTYYTNTGLTAGSTYYYRIAAYKSGLGNMSMPKAVKMSLSAPVITRSCSTSPTTTTLSWSKVYNASGYYVYRSTTASGTYTKIATVTSPSYTDTGLTAGTTYYYKIVAYNSSTTSSMSSYKSILPTNVKTPTIYYGKANSSSSITVKWTNVPGAASYYVYRSTSASGTYSHVGTVSKTSFTNTGLSSGTTYYYKIVAVSSGSLSAFSSYRAVTTS